MNLECFNFGLYGCFAQLGRLGRLTKWVGLQGKELACYFARSLPELDEEIGFVEEIILYLRLADKDDTLTIFYSLGVNFYY